MKIYVLDTSVLLHDPRAIFAFNENEVVIPAVVLEEVDAKKRLMDELGRNARTVSRLIDSLRARGPLHSGVPLENGGRLRVELNHRSFAKMQEIFLEATNDNRILSVALNLQEEAAKHDPPPPVILVSKDALVRVKADALGLRAEDYRSDRVVQDDALYAGYAAIYVEPDVFDVLYQHGKVPTAQLASSSTRLYPNQFLILRSLAGGSASAVVRVSAGCEWAHLLPSSQEPVWGIRPRNVQQKMALSLLLDDEIPLVTLTGKAGTGKTLLTLAVALHKVEEERRYQRLLVARPVVPLGKDIGYLPGEKEEKLRPWMQPIYDNLEYLFNAKQRRDLDRILDGMGSIQVEALTYIRGRNIANQFILIDEAQNLTRHEVKTILTRVGEGSKIVLMGDPHQIDHPYLDAYSNGLTYVVERFKEQPLSGHVRFEKGERSALAQLAADLL
ncbi:PhoH family protein [Calditerricola yamamurae]